MKKISFNHLVRSVSEKTKKISLATFSKKNLKKINKHTLITSGIIVLALVLVVTFVIPPVVARYSPRYYSRHLLSAQTALSANDLTKAEKEYNIALKYKKHDAVIYRDLAFIYQQQKKDDAAATANEKYLATDEVDATTWNSLGNTYRELKQYDKAEQAYRKALSLNPSLTLAVINLSHVFELSNKTDKAIVLLNERYDGSRQKSEIGLRLGLLYKQAGKTSEAKATIQKVVDADPENKKAQDILKLVSK